MSLKDRLHFESYTTSLLPGSLWTEYMFKEIKSHQCASVKYTSLKISCPFIFCPKVLILLGAEVCLAHHSPMRSLERAEAIVCLKRAVASERLPLTTAPLGNPTIALTLADGINHSASHKNICESVMAIPFWIVMTCFGVCFIKKNILSAASGSQRRQEQINTLLDIVRITIVISIITTISHYF